MKKKFLVLLCAGFLSAVQLAMAQTQSPPVAVPSVCGAASDNATLSLKKDLDQRHAALMERFQQWKFRADAFNQKYAGREFDADSQEAKGGAAEQAWLTQEAQTYERAAEAFKADVDKFIAVDKLRIDQPCSSRTYKPSGNALIGGTTWIVGYNVQNADPQLVAKEREMLAQQMRLAGPGHPYSDSVDFNRYNFVLGIAASTGGLRDLSTRVVFDELTNGQFSAEEQQAYNSLKDRQFNELACHSNGAMICLAALENKDVIADHVVLYGPQITMESLGMWDELVRSGRVKSVQIYINQSDPVPPFSLLVGGGSLDAAALSTLAMFKPPTITRVINETSPRLTVRTFSCGDGAPALSCHAMTAYEARVNYKPKPLQGAVPGTTFGGRGSAEPPPP